MTETQKCLLAYDLSTITIGYSIFDLQTKELIKLSYEKLNTKELLEKAEMIDIINKRLFSEYNIQHFVIEESLKSFASGGSNSDALMRTNALNLVCQFNIKDKHHIDPTGMNVNHCRGVVFPMFHKIIRKMKGVKGKDYAFELVKKELGEKMFPTKVMKSGPRKGQVVFIDEAGDMSDSYILGKAWMIENFS